MKRREFLKKFMAGSIALGIAAANVAGLIIGKKPQNYTIIQQVLQKKNESDQGYKIK